MSRPAHGSTRRLLLAPLLFSGTVLACLPKYQPELYPQQLVLTVTGMTCAETCPARVEEALESVVGVESATVAYDARTVTVVYLGRLEPDALVVALRKQGFGAAAH